MSLSNAIRVILTTMVVFLIIKLIIKLISKNYSQKFDIQKLSTLFFYSKYRYTLDCRRYYLVEAVYLLEQLVIPL